MRGTVTQDGRLLERYCLDQAQSARKAQKRAEEYVRRMRAHGASWQAVGAALGITRQSAWERFRHLPAGETHAVAAARPPRRPLRRIAAQQEVAERTEEYVRRMRADGASWQAVGAALGITRQSAWERFRHLDASQKEPSTGPADPYIPDVVLWARHLQPDEFEKLVTDAAKTDTQLEQWLKASNVYISDALGYGVARPPISLLRAMAQSRFLAIAAQYLVAPLPLAGSVSCPICRRFYLNEDFLRRHRARDHLEP